MFIFHDNRIKLLWFFICIQVRDSEQSISTYSRRKQIFLPSIIKYEIKGDSLVWIPVIIDENELNTSNLSLNKRNCKNICKEVNFVSGALSCSRNNGTIEPDTIYEADDDYENETENYDSFEEGKASDEISSTSSTSHKSSTTTSAIQIPSIGITTTNKTSTSTGKTEISLSTTSTTKAPLVIDIHLTSTLATISSTNKFSSSTKKTAIKTLQQQQQQQVQTTSATDKTTRKNDTSSTTTSAINVLSDESTTSFTIAKIPSSTTVTRTLFTTSTSKIKTKADNYDSLEEIATKGTRELGNSTEITSTIKTTLPLSTKNRHNQSEQQKTKTCKNKHRTKSTTTVDSPIEEKYEIEEEKTYDAETCDYDVEFIGFTTDKQNHVYSIPEIITPPYQQEPPTINLDFITEKCSAASKTSSSRATIIKEENLNTTTETIESRNNLNATTNISTKRSTSNLTETTETNSSNLTETTETNSSNLTKTTEKSTSNLTKTTKSSFKKILPKKFSKCPTSNSKTERTMTGLAKLLYYNHYNNSTESKTTRIVSTTHRTISETEPEIYDLIKPVETTLTRRVTKSTKRKHTKNVERTTTEDIVALFQAITRNEDESTTTKSDNTKPSTLNSVEKQENERYNKKKTTTEENNNESTSEIKSTRSHYIKTYMSTENQRWKIKKGRGNIERKSNIISSTKRVKTFTVQSKSKHFFFSNNKINEDSVLLRNEPDKMQYDYQTQEEKNNQPLVRLYSANELSQFNNKKLKNKLYNKKNSIYKPIPLSLTKIKIPKKYNLNKLIMATENVNNPLKSKYSNLEILPNFLGYNFLTKRNCIHKDSYILKVLTLNPYCIYPNMPYSDLAFDSKQEEISK